MRKIKQKQVDSLETAISGKVDKITGKGLSTNDLTSELKTTYDGKKDNSVSATSRVLGRKTAGSGVIEELSVNEILAFIGSVSANQSIRRNANNDGFEFYTPSAGAEKPTALTRTSTFTTTSTAVTTVTGLSFSAGANKKYKVDITIDFGTNGSSGAVYLTTPTDATVKGTGYCKDASGFTNCYAQSIQNPNLAYLGPNAQGFGIFSGIVATGSTAGNIAIKINTDDQNQSVYTQTGMTMTVTEVQ